MKTKRTLLEQVFLWVFIILPATLWGETTLNMPQWGKQTVNVSEEITFYDFKGTDNITSLSYNSSCATTVFTPSESGKAIQITFESIDVHSDGNYFPAYLNIYNGVFDADNTFSYPSSASEVSSDGSYFPSNDNLLAKLEGTYTNLVYTSSASDGSLSVCFHWKYAAESDGWVAKVKTVTLTDMEVTGAAADYSDVLSSVYAGKKDITLGSVNVTADGILNPDKVTSISFTLPKNDGVVDATALKLYKGTTQITATLTENSGTYTFAFEDALTSGDNKYSIVGDVLDSAAFDAELQLAIQGVTSVAYPSGISPFSAGTPVLQTVARMVLLSSTATTYTVGDKPIAFYDDGGPEGTISEGFTGQATFLPETSGKKVMIDFTMIDLFNTSTVGKNDILKIYYGSTVDEANLAATLLNEETATIKSISEDGALTVTLTSTTGTGFKKGFDATVSQFTPEAMTVSGDITTSQYTGDNVAAGDADCAIIAVNIPTTNTEPALTTKSFSFTTNGTFANVTKAVLYSTGSSADFATTTKLGEVDVTADEFTIVTTDAASLREGNNYFWLAYTVSPQASSGATVDATAVSVELSDGAHAITEGNPDGARTVENIAYSSIGTAEKTVYGTWIYKNTPSSSYNTGYASTAGDQIIIFHPGTTGKIIELEFSKFTIAYPYYTSTNPYFRVYSGSTATADNLIWECAEDTKSTGPEAILRSKAADGSLTVVFNANGVSSSYNGGWVAEVREYQSVPMAVDSVTVSQTNTDIISTSSSAKGLDIIGFNVVTSGDLNPISLSDITINLKGCQDKVQTVKLYSLGKTDSDSKTDSIAVATPSADNATLSIAPAQALELSEGNNYFRICFDLKDGFGSNQVIDASLVSVTAGGTQINVTNGDPEGERVTKNIYLLESGTGHEVTVSAGESLMFYDDGGADGKVSTSYKGTVTFIPSTAGKAIKFTVKQWQLGANDKFQISYGAEAKTTPDLTWSNSVSEGDEVISFSEDGKLTVNFSSGSYYQGNGWEIEVSEYTVQPLSLESITVTPVNESSLLPGSADNCLLRVDVAVTGDSGSFPINKVAFSSVGSTSYFSVENYKMFATDTVSTFTTTQQFGSTALSGKNFEFNGEYTATLPGVYRFWLSADMASDAVVGDAVVVSAVSATTQTDVVTDLSEQSAVNATVAAGVHGTFTIGTSDTADFATIAEAVASLAGGIDGAVVFNLENGTYNEKVLIENIKGTSATNTITIQSVSGDYNDVIIEHNSYTEPSVSSDEKGFAEYGVFTVSGTKYVTLKGVTVKTTDTTYPSVIRLRGGSCNFTLSNSYVTAPESESYSTDVDLIEVYVESKMNDQVNHNITIENNLLEGGYNAISTGAQWVTVDAEQGSKVIGNTILNQGSKGVYVSRAYGMIIDGNHFENTVTSKSDFQAIDITATGACQIINNDINLATSNYVSAMNIRSITADATAPGLIANNEIKVECGGTSASYGIKLNSLSENLNIAYNTVRMTGEMASSAPFFSYNEQSAVTVCNNIFQNDATGFVYRANRTSYLEGLTFNNNSLYTAGTNFAYVGSNLSSYADWQTASSEANSVVGQIQFLSNEVLMPADATTIQCAVPLIYVTTDMFGTARSTTNPTIGAIEYAPVPAPAFTEGYPKVTAISHETASLVVNTNTSGVVQVLVHKTSLTAPTAEEVMASENVSDVRQARDYTIKLEGLERSTEYKAYIILYNLLGENSAVLESEAFTTTYLPTTVSTFEDVTATSGDFEDGTALFSGFTVESASSVPQEGTKVAKLTSTAGSITPTNVTTGIALDGFFVKTDNTATMTVYNEASETTRFIIDATDWRYVNLRDKNLITKIELSVAEGTSLYIDNFSGAPSDLAVSLSDIKVNDGTQVTLTPVVDIATGVAPYTYAWSDYSGNAVGSASALSLTADKLTEYSVTVTDAWGNVASASAVITVLGEAKTATFEEMTLNEESHWFGVDPEVEYEGILTAWYSGSYKFSAIKYMETWWSGYSCTNETATSYASLSDQFRSAAGGAYNGSNYSVAYPDNLKIEVTNSEDGDTIRGFYITNTPYATSVIYNGDTFGSSAFKTGDYFMVTITGYNGETETNSINYYLADYRSDKEADHYCLETWQWVDLRPLGKVTNVGFKFSGSQNNSWGLLTPTYLAIDDFNGERVITDKPTLVSPVDTKSYDLSAYFTLETDGATVSYTIETETANEGISVSISEDGQLVVEGINDQATATYIIGATQKGKTQFVRLPIKIDRASGINNIAVSSDIRVYPVPVTDRLNVATALTDYTVELFSTSGACVLSQEGNSGSISIDCDGIDAGVYMLRISNDETAVVKRIIVK